MAITKRELVERVSENTEFPQKQVASIVQNTLDVLSNALGTGRTIELRNFGTFKVKLNKSRIGHNPKKPEKEVIIPAKAIVKFRAGKELKERVERLDIEPME